MIDDHPPRVKWGERRAIRGPRLKLGPRLARWVYPFPGLTVSLLLTAGLIAGIPALNALPRLLHEQGASPTAAGLAATAVELLACLLLLVAAWPLIRPWWADHLGFRAIRRSVIPTILVFSLGFYIIDGALLVLIQVCRPAMPFWPRFQEPGLWTPVAGLVGVVAVAPVVEELLFRGLILGGLRQRYRIGTAIVVSAFLFGVCHVYKGPESVAGACLAGLALGWLRCRMESIVPCIWLHVVHNWTWFRAGSSFMGDGEARVGSFQFGALPPAPPADRGRRARAVLLRDAALAAARGRLVDHGIRRAEKRVLLRPSAPPRQDGWSAIHRKAGAPIRRGVPECSPSRGTGCSSSCR